LTTPRTRSTSAVLTRPRLSQQAVCSLLSRLVHRSVNCHSYPVFLLSLMTQKRRSALSTLTATPNIALLHLQLG